MKQHLINGRPSETAVRLANDIYFTYLYNDNPSLSIPFSRLSEVFGESDMIQLKHRLEAVFEELNEPIVLSDCSIGGRHIQWEMVEFFTYSYNFYEGKPYVELEVNELYLQALETFDVEPYINFQ